VDRGNYPICSSEKREREIESSIPKDVHLDAMQNRAHRLCEAKSVRLAKPKDRRQAALELASTAMIGDRKMF
jgi:hypothetical protein